MTKSKKANDNYCPPKNVEEFYNRLVSHNRADKNLHYPFITRIERNTIYIQNQSADQKSYYSTLVKFEPSENRLIFIYFYKTEFDLFDAIEKEFNRISWRYDTDSIGRFFNFFVKHIEVDIHIEDSINFPETKTKEVEIIKQAFKENKSDTTVFTLDLLHTYIDYFYNDPLFFQRRRVTSWYAKTDR